MAFMLGMAKQSASVAILAIVGLVGQAMATGFTFGKYTLGGKVYEPPPARFCAMRHGTFHTVNESKTECFDYELTYWMEMDASPHAKSLVDVRTIRLFDLDFAICAQCSALSREVFQISLVNYAEAISPPQLMEKRQNCCSNLVQVLKKKYGGYCMVDGPGARSLFWRTAKCSIYLASMKDPDESKGKGGDEQIRLVYTDLDAFERAKRESEEYQKKGGEAPPVDQLQKAMDLL